MTIQQEKWRATLTSRLASPKVKRNAIAGLLSSGIPPKSLEFGLNLPQRSSVSEQNLQPLALDKGDT